MKVEIKQDGTLEVSPENELEAYALKKWVDDNRESLSANILILAINKKKAGEK